jgi:hypothetical protein
MAFSECGTGIDAEVSGLSGIICWFMDRAWLVVHHSNLPALDDAAALCDLFTFSGCPLV